MTNFEPESNWTRSHWLTAGAIFLIALITRLVFRFHIIDDAYITFRYAANLAAGDGFVFNPGSRVLGTTTPIYALLLSIVALIGGTASFPGFAALFGVACDSLVCGLAAAALAIYTRKWFAGAPLGLCLGISPEMVIYATSGMETQVFTLLLTFSLYACIAGYYRSAIITSAVCLLTRPEGILAVLLVALVMFIRRTRPVTRVLVCALAGILGWLLFAWLYYGSPIPHSMTAKNKLFLVTDVPPFPARLLHWPNIPAMVAFWRGFLDKQYDQSLFTNFTAALPLIALLAAACWGMIRRRSSFIIVPLATLLYSAAYAFSHTLIFPWYFVPLVPLLAFSAFAGAWEAFLLIQKQTRAAWTSLLFPALSLIMIAGQAKTWATMHNGFPSAIQRLMISPNRELLYSRAAAHLGPAADGKSVMTLEIGTLGFRMPGSHFIDGSGLVSPEAVEFFDSYAAHKGKISPELAHHFRPDYIISLTPHFATPPHAIPGYQIITSYNARDQWGQTEVWILSRTGAP